MIRMRISLLALTVATVTACGAPPSPLPGGPQSLRLTAAGGTLQATGADGIRYTIVFPPGAVRFPVDVTLTPLDPVGDALGRFRVEPALELELPAHVALTLPDGANPSPWAAFAFEGDPVPVHVATTVDGTTLRTELPYLALPALETVAAGLAPAQADADAIQVVAADCATRLDGLRWLYDAFMASNSYEAALRVVMSGGALASACAAYEELGTFLASIDEPACARYDDLVLVARVIAADTYDRFNELLQPVMAWQGTLQALGVVCEESPTATAVLEEKYVQFLAFYGGRVASAFTAEFERLLNEARKTFRLQGRAATLGLSDAAVLLEAEVLHEVMDQLRERAYDACVASADHYYLSTALEAVFLAERPSIGPVAPAGVAARAPAVLTPLAAIARFTDDDVIADLWACASTLIVEVWADPDVPVEVTANRRELRPADTAGERNDTAATVAPVEGHLVLRGPIEPFLCGPSRTVETHELIVSFAGREVHRLPTLAGNPEIDVEAALVQAGRSTAGVNTVDLVVRRESPACGGLYGADHTLFTVTVTTDPAPRVTDAGVTPGALVAGDEFATFAFQVDWSDGGENLATLEVTFDLAGATSRDTVDLATAPPELATGFTGGGGGGTYQQDLRVFCSEQGKSPILVSFVLEDAFGQRSPARTTSLPVSYGACAAPTSVAAIDAPGLERRAPGSRP